MPLSEMQRTNVSQGARSGALAPSPLPSLHLPVVPAEVRDEALLVLRVLRRADSPPVADEELVDVTPGLLREEGDEVALDDLGVRALGEPYPL